jgi:hypothetical protein
MAYSTHMLSHSRGGIRCQFEDALPHLVRQPTDQGHFKGVPGQSALDDVETLDYRWE